MSDGYSICDEYIPGTKAHPRHTGEVPSHLLLRLFNHLRDRRVIDHTDHLYVECVRPRDFLQKWYHLGVTDTDCDRHLHLLVGNGVGAHPSFSEPIFTD